MVGTATTDEGAKQAHRRRRCGKVARRDATPRRCDALLAAIQKELGAVAILVNNAGITRDNLPLRMKDEEWDEVMATNLQARCSACRARCCAA